MSQCPKCESTARNKVGLRCLDSFNTNNAHPWHSAGEWLVISPDGIAISPETYPSEEAARQALTEWCKRYEAQGFYSAVDGRIPLAKLSAACQIVDAGEEEAHVPVGRCPKHPWIVTGNGMFDAPCPLCESLNE